MSAPRYVPKELSDKPRQVEKTPPADPWLPTRPGDIEGRQPTGTLLGAPGPDQGYALKLVPLFESRVVLAEGEDHHDVDAGCVAVALKRASLFGRAPIVHDLEVAYTVWGYLRQAPADLVEARTPLFAGIGHHAYHRVRAVADAVPDETLRMTPAEVAESHEADWRFLVELPLDTPDPA